jgi:hypothetical protein
VAPEAVEVAARSCFVTRALIDPIKKETGEVLPRHHPQVRNLDGLVEPHT